MEKFTHQELVDIAYRWVMGKSGFAFKELVTMGEEIPDVIGFRSGETQMMYSALRRLQLRGRIKEIYLTPNQ